MFNLPVNYTVLTWQQRRAVRELYVKQQNNLCHYCKTPLTEKPHQDVLSKTIHPFLFPPNFFKYPVHLHHNHDTGITIGAVHNYCNAVLWEYHKE